MLDSARKMRKTARFELFFTCVLVNEYLFILEIL